MADGGARNKMAGLGKWLAGGIGVVTAATAAVGIGSGDLERVLRNEAPQALLYLMLVAIGIGSGVIVWQTADDPDPDNETRVKGLALAGIIFGAMVLALSLFWPSTTELSTARWWSLGVAGALLAWALGVLIAASLLTGGKEDLSDLGKRYRVLVGVAGALVVVAMASELIAIYAESATRYWVFGAASAMAFGVLGVLATMSLPGIHDKTSVAGAKRNKLVTYAATATIVLSFCISLLALYTNSARVGAVVVGVLTAIVALAWTGWPLKFSVSSILVSIGFVAFFVGLSGFFALAVDNTSAKDRPTIDASLSIGENGGLSLQVNVVAGGLRTDEHVLVTVEGLHSAISLSDVRAGRGESAYRLTNFGDSAQPLHLSRTGPDQEGSVDLTMVVPISPGLYERIRINAFLVSADSSDFLGQIEQLDRRVSQANEQRRAFDLEQVFEVPEELQKARQVIDEAYLKGDIEDEHYARLLVERSTKDSELYDELVGDEELAKRNAFDQEIQAERTRLREELEKEIVEDVRCAVGAQARGCVIILVPETPVRPQINAHPSLGDDGWNADIAVEMASMSAEEIVILTVLTRRFVDEPFIQVYAAQLPPNRVGALVGSVVLPLAEDVADVCTTGIAIHTSDVMSGDTGPTSDCESEHVGVTAVVFSIPREPAETSSPTTSTTTIASP